MNNDLISRNDLINAKPEFMNENVVRDTTYRTTKDRIYAKAWNACNSYWLNTIKNAPTVRLEYVPNYANCESVAMVRVRPQGKWISDYRTCKCSVCNFTTVIDTYNFCPNCGADMKGAEG